MRLPPSPHLVEIPSASLRLAPRLTFFPPHPVAHGPAGWVPQGRDDADKYIYIFKKKRASPLPRGGGESLLCVPVARWGPRPPTASV